MLKKIMGIVVVVIIGVFAIVNVSHALSAEQRAKLQKNIDKANENPANQDGCLIRKFKVTQVNEGGSWTGPFYLENPGYSEGSYRMTNCQEYKGSTSLAPIVTSAGISAKQISDYFCVTAYPHLDKSKPIYVRTATSEWTSGMTNTIPQKTYREVEVECHASSNIRNKCECK